jgi:peptidoglycan/LPS O-acetylase OafA/YrhL
MEASGISTRRPERLDALTALRFIAATATVLHHSRGHFGVSPHFLAPFNLAQGVSFFFVLSGFILAHVYPKLKPADTPRFLLARLARVWPAHIATLLLLFVLLPDNLHHTMRPGDSPGPVALLLNLTLTHAWNPIRENYLSFNAVSWSISTELGLYILFLLLIPRWSRTWWYKLPLSLAVVAGMILLARSELADIGNLTPMNILYVSPFARLFEFTLGMTAALAFGWLRPRARLGLFRGACLELLALGLVLWPAYNTVEWGTRAAALPWVGRWGAVWLVNGGVTCLGFAAFIVVIALGRGPLARLLSLRAPVLLGELSFSIYLVHQVYIRYYDANSATFASLSHEAAYAGFWVATLLTSYLMWRGVERPCRRYIVGLGRRTARAASTEPSAPASAAW